MSLNLDYPVISRNGSKNNSTTKKRSKLITISKGFVSLLLFVLVILSYLNKNVIMKGIDREEEENNINDDNISVSNIDIIDDKYNEDELGFLLDPSKYIQEVPFSSENAKKKKLTGKFIHITDPHPDPYYQEEGILDTACHRLLEKDNEEEEEVEEVDNDDYDHFPMFSAGGILKNDISKIVPTKAKVLASKFGDPMLGCDSPIILVTETFQHLANEFKGDIDFILWTGDNSRHDNDRKIPRTSFEIMGNNMDLSERLSFHFPDIPIVPTIGNNDIYPHNLMDLGPSMITRQLGTIYEDMIPEEQRNLYERYGSFFNEVIPGKLAIISLNTMFFFKNNPVVDSCMKESDPGYQQLLWLGSVLNQFRAAGIKCWIISHVPIIQKNLEESCYLKLNLWVYEYRDVIIGNLMGHMNLDYFNVIKGDELRSRLKNIHTTRRLKSKMEIDSDDDIDGDLFLGTGAAPVNKRAYLKKVKKEYKVLDKGLNLKKVEKVQSNYHIVNVAGSIIPTFNPAFRIWKYNISDVKSSGDDKENLTTLVVDWKLFFEDLEKEMDNEINTNTNIDPLKKNKKDKSIPKKKPVDLELGPAYDNQFGSPLSFTQYYLDLDKLNEEYYKKMGKKGSDSAEVIKKIFKYQVEYTSDDLLELAEVKAKDLTVKTYLKLMNGLISKNKIWKKFLKWVFVSTDY